ncbi:DUF2188 domain-containing protein [Dokdonia donghaensis]|uniref:DUF2188 domain-containing protein n=1 Tax=Dokdonia donghaensis DSW-1 TaxID=1300343 RepID=A0A0A2H447_9FLAO|nr:DUF2188 domain-containing protein [Dokdonia donghaensis]ANH60082.1 hypothetical protein I597_1164 [Dokdonia donghaensis DSW-1]KGO07385.1 hypothetical protein NV36_11425 [Dokdonia donghaensis DSW-1]
MSSIKTFLRSLLEIVENVYENSRKASRKRTWHQHVVPYEGDWAVRREGNKRITSKHQKQSTAIRKAKSIARKRKADVIIHRAGGGIRERISYD